MAQTFHSRSVTETKDIAKNIINNYKKLLNNVPIVFLLYGDLGAGKTVFVKGIAEEFDINDISSPTFIIVDEYDVQNRICKKLIHIDLYRVEGQEEFQNLKIIDFLEKGNIVCIEWSENIPPILSVIEKKAKVIKIMIDHKNETERAVSISQ